MRTQFQLHQLQRYIFSWKQVLYMTYFIDYKEIFKENIPSRDFWRVARGVDVENTIDGTNYGITFKLEPSVDKTAT